VIDRFDPDKAYHKIYYKSCDEFEQVREICLQEDNWLRYNYTKDNLKIEDHTGFGVVYRKDTHEPMVMGGVFNDGRWPSNVGRMLNRAYVFPNYRSRTLSELTVAFKILHHHLIFPLIAVNKYDLYFQTMQNREKPSKRWWDVWKAAMAGAAPSVWTECPGYLQTCHWPVKKCWQNFVYHETVPGSFVCWDPKIINHTQWELMPEGN
jgi:hypothetical protein